MSFPSHRLCAEGAAGTSGRSVSGSGLASRPTSATSLSASTGPVSPPEMNYADSASLPSASLRSDDNNVLDDIGHFEDIGLDDAAAAKPGAAAQPYHPRDPRGRPGPPKRTTSNPYGRIISEHHPHSLGVSSPSSAASPLSPPTSRDIANFKGRRKPELSPNPHDRSTLSSLKNEPRGYSPRSSSLNARSPDLAPRARGGMPHPRGLASRSTTSLHLPDRRHRSPSPNHTIGLPRRSSSRQSVGGRKSIAELEKECGDDDDDEDDNIPDGFVLDNVPMSPRPNTERPVSRSSSRAPSAERTAKERVRSVGSGTPAVAIARGSLKSPTWKTDGRTPSTSPSPGPGPDRRGESPSPMKARAKSWNVGYSDLSSEARALTEKLEEHADEGGDPSEYARGRKPEQRVKSALPDLPSLRQANMMIDAMPMSKEKEALVGRTRPSWLPPKDPAEDKRHWKEYEKMMARSAEAERRREADRMAKSNNRDTTADGLMRIWEDDIVPRWTDAIRERRTRELWWRGVASRSRGVVWQRAIGNELGLSETSYKAALNRAQETEARVKAGKGDSEDIRKGAWLSKIREDVNDKTWQDLRIFQLGGPLHQALVDLLSAYTMYRSDIGYVTGCNTVAALLLLNLSSPTAAFIALANVLNRSLSLGFYASDPGAQASAYNLVLQTLHVKSPGLYDHLARIGAVAEPDEFLVSVFKGLGTCHLAMDECARLWDVYVFEGDAVMVRAATALLLRQEMALLGTSSVEQVAKVIGNESGAAKNGKVSLAGGGDEEKWMTWLREAGKS